MRLEFTALELTQGGGIEPARYCFEESSGGEWIVSRDGCEHVRLGRGYRLLRVAACGVCATDLARADLPFPLPQVAGHEVVARDQKGRWFVVEINASHASRGLRSGCAFCARDLGNHCPERLVLGIDRLPGGFGPFVLVPVENIIEIPEGLSPESALLIEPFAAALSAVRVVEPEAGDTIAVLGPRRLGMLVIAALAAWRRRHGFSFEIVALCRRESLHRLARDLGADRILDVAGLPAESPSAVARVVIDTTGTPEGLELALALAEREVHLKSTHGRKAAGLEHLTEMVVDEISLRPLGSTGRGEGTFVGLTEPTWPGGEAPRRVAWLADATPPGELGDFDLALVPGETAAEVLANLESEAAPNGLPRADVVVVDRPSRIDEVLRPEAEREVSLVRPRGAIAATGEGAPSGRSALWDAVVGRRMKVTTSRCGDFRSALDLMVKDAALGEIGRKMITHKFSADALRQAFSTARSDACVKAVVLHEALGREGWEAR